LSLGLFVDYSLDTSGFFTTERRTLLVNTLLTIINQFNDSLDAVPSRTYSISTSTGTKQVTTAVSADTIKIYAFGDALSGTSVGLGTASWTESGSQGLMRGQAANDFAPDVGFIQFDNDGSTNWFFGSSTTGLSGSQTDFVTVARHEMLHVLGFSTGQPTFDRYTVNSTFVGPTAEAANNNAPVPMNGSHVAASISSVMNAVTLNGTRQDLRPLEWGMLKDLGWNVQIATPAPDLGAHPLYLDFGASGLWAWSPSAGYVQLSPSDPQALAASPDGSVFVDFGAAGVQRWSQANGFQLINGSNPEGIAAGSDGSLFVDFGAYGIWRWTAAGGIVLLNASNPQSIVAAPDSSLFIDFGAYGIWRWSAGAGFVQIGTGDPQGLAVPPAGGSYDGSLFIDFGTGGLWRWSPKAGYQLINASNPEGMAAAADGSLAVDFGAFGLWRWTAAGGLQQLNTVNPEAMAFGSNGWLYIDFGPAGLWVWVPSGAYVKLHPGNVQGLATS